MGRLIDADDVMEMLTNIELSCTVIPITEAKLRLRDIPTAYDIDKVVEELEERTDFLKNCTKYGNKNAKQQAESYSTIMMYEVAYLVDDLIEVVKHGGVSDDVCEWRLCDEEANVYDTSCKNPHILIEGTPKENNYEYCPYCGKKIKVVEYMDDEEFCYCHNDDTDEEHDCLDYMECEEYPYYYGDLD